ncbi:MAG TPA: cytochrome c [Candidatus Acidoferrales bacterium]|jgi:mono/diheme cytochrome c family protein|nr:cytochrome c [Candidatus Acidoferrales bacterium]
MCRIAFVAALALVCLPAISAPSAKKPSQKFTKKQIAHGADVYARNCSPCHGAHMDDPNGAFDLRTFPPDQHDRFVNSVTNGKNSMPPWGSLLKPADIEALWAYVMAGQKHTTPSKSKGSGTN